MDTEYHPRSEAVTDAQTTPSARLRANQQVDEKTKNRVRAVDPCHGRCLVENVHPERAVEFAHCVPRRFRNDEKMLTTLEWYWGMEHLTLSLDTRYNIFPCGAALHAMHDKDFWMFIPEEHIIQRFYESLSFVDDEMVAMREHFPTFQETTFRYRLFSISRKMVDIPVFYQHTVPRPRTTPSSSNFTAHVYPYTNLPLLTSHLHPKFVIFEAGRKLDLLPSAEIFDLILATPILRQIAVIHTAWTKPTPDDAMDDERFNPPHAGDDSSDSDDHDGTRTAKRRRRSSPNHGSPTPRKSQRLQGSGDNTAPAEKGQHSGHKRPSHSKLSGRTLYEHAQVVGKQKWTVDSIRSWSEQCDRPVYA